jgi:hypothetical protein
MPDSEILHYFGTPIEQLSREELIEVVKYLYQEHAELLQSHRSLRKEHFCNPNPTPVTPPPFPAASADPIVCHRC